MTVTVGGVVVAGSAIEHDGVQIGAIQMLGLSGGKRHSTFAYDARSRVSASLFGRLGEASAPTAAMPGRAAEVMSVADFRAGQERQSRLDPGVANSLGGVDTSKVDPPSMTASGSRPGSHLRSSYMDSSNVYAFAARDPVNGRDPTGQITIILHGTLAGTNSERPESDSWWRSGGFAANLDVGAKDAWKITTAGGKHVSEVRELAGFGPRGMFQWES